MSTATAGRAREYRVRDHLVTKGWLLVARSAGSKGVADLVMVHPQQGLALVQVGTANKQLGPDTRGRFVALANLCSALPILATATRTGIRYFHVTRDTPSTWQEYTP